MSITRPYLHKDLYDELMVSGTHTPMQIALLAVLRMRWPSQHKDVTYIYDLDDVRMHLRINPRKIKDTLQQMQSLGMLTYLETMGGGKTKITLAQRYMPDMCIPVCYGYNKYAPTTWLMLLALIRHRNTRSGTSKISLTKLAVHASCSAKQLQRAKCLLMTQGVITQQKHRQHKLAWKHNVYTLSEEYMARDIKTAKETKTTKSPKAQLIADVYAVWPRGYKGSRRSLAQAVAEALAMHYTVDEIRKAVYGYLKYVTDTNVPACYIKFVNNFVRNVADALDIDWIAKIGGPQQRKLGPKTQAAVDAIHDMWPITARASKLMDTPVIVQACKDAGSRKRVIRSVRAYLRGLTDKAYCKQLRNWMSQGEWDRNWDEYYSELALVTERRKQAKVSIQSKYSNKPTKEEQDKETARIQKLIRDNLPDL